MLAASWDAVELKKRGFKMRVGDVAGNICQAPPTLEVMISMAFVKSTVRPVRRARHHTGSQRWAGGM